MTRSKRPVSWLTASGVAGFLVAACGSGASTPAAPDEPASRALAEAESPGPATSGESAHGEADTSSEPQLSRLECPQGQGDCDYDPSNGCEVDVTSDAKNCRFCGQACDDGAVCMDSVCRALTPPEDPDS